MTQLTNDNIASLDLLVSVVMPVYNAENTLCRAVKSVLNQTHHNLELILVDDCSSDDSRDLAEQLEMMDPRIQLITLTNNEGAGIARNTAIRAANGKYIAFLDADDQWVNTKLEIQLKAFAKTDATLICSGYFIVDEDFQILGFKQPSEWLSHKDMLKSNFIGCLTAIYSVDKIGKQYMPTIRKRQDYALWLNITQQTGAAYCVQEKLSYYSVGSKSISSNKLSMLKWNFMMFKDTQNYSTLAAALLTLRNAFNKFFKD